MIILILDDDADIRHKAVERHFAKDHTVLHAFTADEAVSILMTCQERVGIALLDHDLQDFAEENGRRIERHGVYFLAKMFNTVPEERWPAQFVLHSHNVPGVRNMSTDLRGKGQVFIAMAYSQDMLAHLAERIRPQ